MHIMIRISWHVYHDMYIITCQSWYTYHDWTCHDMYIITSLSWHVYHDIRIMKCISWYVYHDIHIMTCISWQFIMICITWPNLYHDGHKLGHHSLMISGSLWSLCLLWCWMYGVGVWLGWSGITQPHAAVLQQVAQVVEHGLLVLTADAAEVAQEATAASHHLGEGNLLRKEQKEII